MKISEHRKHQIYRNTVGLLPRSRVIYKVCHIYIRHYFGFNWGVTADDGEIWLATQVLRNAPTPTVFDVGANVGDWTLGILKYCPNALIHAFEPGAKAYKRMTVRVTAPNVKMNQLGVGARRDTLQFYEYGSSQVSSLHSRTGTYPVANYLVDVMPITEYCQNNDIRTIDFLKIDTEGHDFYCLQGADTLLKQQAIGTIQFEYGPGNINSGILLKDIFDYIEMLPYDIFRLYPRYLLPVPQYDHEMENFVNVNYVLIANKQLDHYKYLLR